jgi:hypothetical protein
LEDDGLYQKDPDSSQSNSNVGTNGHSNGAQGALSGALKDLAIGIFDKSRKDELQAYEQSLRSRKRDWAFLKGGKRTKLDLKRIFSDLDAEIDILDMKVGYDEADDPINRHHWKERHQKLWTVKEKVGDVLKQFNVSLGYIPPQERLLATHAFAHLEIGALYKGLSNLYDFERGEQRLDEILHNFEMEYSMINTYPKYKELEKKLRNFREPFISKRGAINVKNACETKDYSWKANVMAAYNLMEKKTGQIKRAISTNDPYLLYGGEPLNDVDSMLKKGELDIKSFMGKRNKSDKKHLGWKGLSSWYIFNDYVNFQPSPEEKIKPSYKGNIA